MSITINSIIYKSIPNFRRYLISQNGDIYSTLSNKIVTDHVHRDGYRGIALFDDDGNRRYKRLHRLVLQAWVGDGGKLECCHRNDIKTDCHVGNLFWADHRTNMSTVSVSRRLTAEEVTELLMLHALYSGRGRGSFLKLAQHFGISATAVRYHCRPQTEKRQDTRRSILMKMRDRF